MQKKIEDRVSESALYDSLITENYLSKSYCSLLFIWMPKPLLYSKEIDFLLRQRGGERSRLQQCWMLKSSGEKPETGPLSHLRYISGLGPLAIQHTMRIQITILLTGSIWRSEFMKNEKEKHEKMIHSCNDSLLIAESVRGPTCSICSSCVADMHCH